MLGVRPLAGVVLVTAALLLTSCATGGPAGISPRTSCSDSHYGDPGMRPLFFMFCVQSP